MIIVLDNIRSALNVGSIIRTADAFNIEKIYFCGITPGPENPKVKKTSLGAEKSVNAEETSSTLETVLKLKEGGHRIIGLELAENAIDIQKSDTADTDKIVLILGNEVSGISPDVLSICDVTYYIPMKGVKESLNVAVAFGIAAYALRA